MELYKVMDFSKNENIERTCCDDPNIAACDGYMVCTNCGMVIDKVFENTPRRAFSQEEITKRKHHEYLTYAIGPRTIIKGFHDSKGNPVSPSTQEALRRIRKIQRTLRDSFERNMKNAIPIFMELQNRLSLSRDIINDAIRIYQESVKKRLAIGRSIEILVVASIYVSLKIHSNPRMIEELIKELELNKKKVLKTARMIILNILPLLHMKIKHVTPIQYIEKIGEDLHINMKARLFARKLIELANKNGFLMEGKDPKGLAAAAIYLGCQYMKSPRTQHEISKAANVTEVTLRQRSREIRHFIWQAQKEIPRENPMVKVSTYKN